MIFRAFLLLSMLLACAPAANASATLLGTWQSKPSNMQGLSSAYADLSDILKEGNTYSLLIDGPESTDYGGAVWFRYVLRWSSHDADGNLTMYGGTDIPADVGIVGDLKSVRTTTWTILDDYDNTYYAPDGSSHREWQTLPGPNDWAGQKYFLIDGFDDTAPTFSVALYEGVYIPSNIGVPEPATWALLIGGFGLVGGATRLNRRAIA